MGRIWAVCSGSGGVGKTTVALSLAERAAKRGYRVILLDASGISRACDLILGLESVITIDLRDVLSQQLDIQAALYAVPGRENLRIANASLYDGMPIAELSGAVLALQSMCDYLIIDLPVGCMRLGEGVMTSEDNWLLVTRPDDASIRACERLLQAARGTTAGMSLIVNRSQKTRIKRGTQYSAEAVAMLLDCALLGAIPEDENLAVRRGKSAMEYDGPVRSVLKSILEKLL